MYFITLVPKIKGLDSFDTLLEEGWGDEDTPIIGYFDSMEEVESVVTSREILGYQRPHGYLVVEKVGTGLMPEVETVAWFKCNKEGIYERIPDVESVVVNFAEIG